MKVSLKQQFGSLSHLSTTSLRREASMCMKLLQFCVDKQDEKRGRLIHNQIITNGFAWNITLSTKLIIFYSKVADLVDARKVFDRMSDRSVVSWTAQISGYTQNGHYEDALLLFVDMHRAGFRANQFTYGSVLRACTGLRCLERGMQIQGCLQKSRFVDNLFVESALVDLHSKCGEMVDAFRLFQTMSRRDVVAWNAIIGGYAIQGLADDSFAMLRLMMREGVVPDCFTLGSVLKVSSRASCLTWVSQIHGYAIRFDYCSCAALTGSLIDAYAKCESIRSARCLYESMKQKDVICFTALMTGYARDRNYINEALGLFKEIQQINMGIDNVLFCSMLNICANIASLTIGRQIHALATKCMPHYDLAMGNALVDMYAKSGEIQDAKCAFHEMEEKNVISWTCLIDGYGKHGYGHEAVSLYKKMEFGGLKPNDITFLSLLFGCSHAGLTDEALECFNEMISRHNIAPRAEHFSCMVDLYARRGQLEEAHNMISKMNIKPNASLWGAILGACCTYGNVLFGKTAAMHLFSMDPENSVNYVVLASMYTATGAWNDAQKVRNLLKERKLKKVTASSLLQSTEIKFKLLQPNQGGAAERFSKYLSFERR